MKAITKKFNTLPDCLFIDCPPGLFLHNGRLGLKVEYFTQALDGTYYADAYCCDTGEYWNGGATSSMERNCITVTPIEETQIPNK